CSLTLRWAKAPRMLASPRQVAHRSTKGLPGPKHIHRRMLIAVGNETAAWSHRGANSMRFLHSFATCPTVLRGVVRGHHSHLFTGACCLVLKGGADLSPAGIRTALGQRSLLHPSGDLQVFERDRVGVAYQVERHLVVKVLALASHLLMLLSDRL